MDDILVEESQKKVTSATTGENQQFLKGFLMYDIIQFVNFIQNLRVHVFWTFYFIVGASTLRDELEFYFIFFNDLQEPLMKNWKLLPLKGIPFGWKWQGKK